MDTDFLYLEDGIIKNIKFQDIVSNKRVLFCSFTRPYEVLANSYVKYIDSRIEFLKEHGVDAVYFVNSTHNRILLYAYNNRNLSTQLLYNNKTFVEHLKQQRNITSRDTNFLISYWNFQALFKNGDLEYLVDAPIDNPIRDAVKINPHFFKLKGKTFLESDPNLILWTPNFSFFEHKDAKGSSIPKLMFYNNLWPSNKLEQYLLDNKR